MKKYSDYFERSIGLVLWIPLTIIIILTAWLYIGWEYLGITFGINQFYTDKFESSYDSFYWIIGQIEWVGVILICVIAFFYLLLTKKLFINKTVKG
jgi:hypothetical protein